MSGIDMPAAKKKTTKRTTTGETTRMKNTIALLQRDLADALNREKAAKDQARAVAEDRASILTRLQEANNLLETQQTNGDAYADALVREEALTKELEQVRANAVGMADWLQRVTTEAQVREEQREALAEKYVNTTLDAHEIAKYAVTAYDQALLAESALTAAGAYIDRLNHDLNATDRVLMATTEALAQLLKVPVEVVYTLVDHNRVTDLSKRRVAECSSYVNRLDRFEKSKAKMADIRQKVLDYAHMPVDKVKMRLDAGLPVAATYEWKAGTSFFGENPPPATIGAMASMQEGTTP